MNQQYESYRRANRVTKRRAPGARSETGLRVIMAVLRFASTAQGIYALARALSRLKIDGRAHLNEFEKPKTSNPSCSHSDLHSVSRKMLPNRPKIGSALRFVQNADDPDHVCNICNAAEPRDVQPRLHFLPAKRPKNRLIIRFQSKDVARVYTFVKHHDTQSPLRMILRGTDAKPHNLPNGCLKTGNKIIMRSAGQDPDYGALIDWFASRIWEPKRRLQMYRWWFLSWLTASLEPHLVHGDGKCMYCKQKFRRVPLPRVPLHLTPQVHELHATARRDSGSTTCGTRTG